MKKFLSLILVAIMVLCCTAVAEETTPRWVREDPSSIGDTVVVYSTLDDAQQQTVEAIWYKYYPDCTIEWISDSVGKLVARARSEINNPYADVLMGGLFESDGTVYHDILQPYTSTIADELTVTDPYGYYTMFDIQYMALVVNEELEAELGLKIESYEDLLDPKLKGMIATADPNSSSSAWNNLSNIMAVYGHDTEEAWAYIEKLMPNLVILGSSSGVFKNTQAGEYVVGLTYEDGAVGLVRDGATNIRLQYPTNGTSASAFGCALIKGGPNPENGKLFIDFICSAEGQTALAAYQQGTLRYTNAGYEVPENAWLKPSNEIVWANRDVPYLTEHKGEILDKWNALWAKVTQ